MRIASVSCLCLIVVAVLGVAVQGVADLESFDPIVIMDDNDFNSDHGVRYGTGSLEDPYVISGWKIDAQSDDACIRIENVDSMFRIEHCALFNADRHAIRLANVEHARINTCCIANSRRGVQWSFCRESCISGCSFVDINCEAVELIQSSGCKVRSCLFTKAAPAIGSRSGSIGNEFVENVFLASCQWAIRLDPQCGGNLITRNDIYPTFFACSSDSYNRWTDAEGNGNFWSRYRGEDRDEDGVGDSYYRILGEAREFDQHPAMTPFHPEAPSEWNLCIDDG